MKGVSPLDESIWLSGNLTNATLFLTNENEAFELQTKNIDLYS